MNIVYTTNDAFVPQVGCGICSVLENNREIKELTIYVIGQGITERNARALKKLAARYDRELQLIPLGDLKEYIDFSFDTAGWNPIVLARLLLDRLLPDTVEKVLYLDGDTLCLDSLEEMWDTPMEHKMVSGCIEATVPGKRRRELGLVHTPYINAGVLLINLKRWRELGGTRQVLSYYKQRGGKLFANDQDAINGALKTEITYLPPRYNFYNIYWSYPYRYLKKLMGDAWYYDRATYDASCAHPAIIHYLGEERPWREGNRHKFRREYAYYLHKTPWRRQPMEQGWKLYYLCWGMFQTILKPFPAVRYHIITGLIPAFMKLRSHKLNADEQSPTSSV